MKLWYAAPCVNCTKDSQAKWTTSVQWSTSQVRNSTNGTEDAESQVEGDHANSEQCGYRNTGDMPPKSGSSLISRREWLHTIRRRKHGASTPRCSSVACTGNSRLTKLPCLSYVQVDCKLIMQANFHAMNHACRDHICTQQQQQWITGSYDQFKHTISD